MGQNKRPYEPLALFLGVVLIGCLVQAAGWLKGDRLVFPGVFEILKAFFRLLGDRQTYAKILVTLRHLLISVLVSSALGVAIGIAEGSNRFLRSLLRPLMALLRFVPMVIMVVVIMVLTKYERVPVIATSMFLVPLIAEAACQGVLELDRDLLDVYRLEGDLSFRVVRMVHLPLMAGYLRQAFINAVGLGMKIVVSTEYLVQTRNSLGKAIYSSSYFNEYQDIYAYALVMIVLVLLVSELPSLLAKLSKRR
ncbi:MAG: ABC transporter permease subunit [Spirochaetales bacterium]|nr:ABC transporter permease subunit [Spirochaetales bacterium]